MAALFTEDGVLVASDGMFSGRQAIEKRYEGTFQRWPLTLFNDLRDCHLKTIDNAVWSFGEWGVLFKARLVSSLSKATFQRFMFVRMMFGRSAC